MKHGLTLSLSLSLYLEFAKVVTLNSIKYVTTA